ncbi:MAG: DUF3048 domain-containing protein [Firmicutes bacterium]|nr:DUF3048 domain-containing protein [Bacillota bacterium]
MKKFLALILCSVMLFSACSSDEPVSSEIEQPGTEATEEVVEVDPYEGMDINPLTGLYIDEEDARRRAFAVVINNLPKALPQSGLGDADIFYEVLAEGGITRLVAIFQELDAEKIGPVRSARDYFTYFALDNDAVFVHHGGSNTGYAAIKNRSIDNLDGMSCQAFWRDQERFNTPGMYEHSSYTDGAGILASAEDYGYGLAKNDTPMFKFSEEEVFPSGEGAKDITLNFSADQISNFVYSDVKGEYYRYQNGEAHIDELTGETIAVKNVIVQFANMFVIPGDEAGRREVELVGSGTGYYFTNGKYEPISWTKNSYSSPTKWYGADGKELELNKGKTFICVYPEGFDVTMQ